MMRPDLKALAEGMVETVKSYVRQMSDTLGGRIAALEKRVDGVALKEGPQGREGPPGKDAEAVDVAEIVRSVVAALPAPVAGSPGKDGAPGADGKSLALEDVRPLIDAEVERTMTAAVARAVAALPPPPAGRDGRDGLNGVQGEKGVDGKDGRDGADGLGFDDLSVEHDGERGFTVKFQQGDRVKSFSFTLPIVLDRGVYKEGQDYQRGDGATFAGSFWIAQAETKSKPDAGDGTWRLAVKRGRDGRDGAPGERGEKGAKGEPGLDGRRYA